MAKQRIEKTIIVLDEAEVRQALQLAQEHDRPAIMRFVTQIIGKKVEAALRKRCG